MIRVLNLDQGDSKRDGLRGKLYRRLPNVAGEAAFPHIRTTIKSRRTSRNDVPQIWSGTNGLDPARVLGSGTDSPQDKGPSDDTDNLGIGLLVHDNRIPVHQRSTGSNRVAQC